MEEGLTIRTMKDDIAEFRGQKPSGEAESKELRPIPKKHGVIRQLLVLTVSVVAVAIVGFGAWYGYKTFTSPRAVAVLSDTPMDIVDVIPKDALAVVEYNISDDASRSVIKEEWSTAGASSGDQSALANPTALADIEGISRLYYFVLPGDSAPFIVFKKTPASTTFISQLSGVQFAEQGGWYVAHAVNLNGYVSDLAQGSFKSSSNASLISKDGYIARFIIQSYELDGIFSLPIHMPSIRQQVVFDIVAAGQGGALHGKYVLSQQAVPEQLHPNTADLAALVPVDATFLRVGENFSTDITSWQQKYTLLDTTQYSAPAIQQFIAKLTGPYTFYSRVGADGVPDVGLVIQLPDALRKKISYSEPVIEQLLGLFAPLITGRPLTDQIVFASGAYASIPIRYANLAGKTASLDYTVGDNFILISSSKEGMSTLADMALTQGPSMLSSQPWSALVSAARSLASYNMIAGLIKDPSVLSLIPSSGHTGDSLPVLVSTKGDNTGITTEATVLLAK